MTQEIKERLEGLENIIHSVHHNLRLLNYLTLNLHTETFNLFNNKGLLWIWSNTMALQIIDFYKLISKHEKFSFVKIINIAQNTKVKADYEKLRSLIEEMEVIYEQQNYETVRSKYLAHQDLNVPEIRTDLKGINIFSIKAIKAFEFFSAQFDHKITPFDEEVENSFSEIFQTIDEYEKVKALFLARLIQQEKTVNISEVQEIIGSPK